MEFAYCGLNCKECAVYLASVSQNTEEQARLAKEYSTETCKFEKEDLYCLGCHSDTVSEKMCAACEIRNCGMEKSCQSCAECGNFPCSILETYLREKPDLLNHLKQLAAKNGKEI